jgi:hypothetical protein
MVAVQIVKAERAVVVEYMFLPFAGSPFNFPSVPVDYRAEHRVEGQGRGDAAIALGGTAFRSEECVQEVAMIRTFSELASSGTPDPKWAREAILTQVSAATSLVSLR